MLCQACTQVFEGQLKPGLHHHSTALEFQRASEIGCQLCRLLWASFSRYITTADLSKDDVSVTYGVQRAKDSPLIGYRTVPADLYMLGFTINTAESVTSTSGSTDDEDRYRVFLVEPVGDWSTLQHLLEAWNLSSGSDLTGSASHHTVSSHTASEACLALAQDWLVRCLKNHVRCNIRHQLKPYRPTRLVEILPLGGNKDLRLIHTNRTVPDGPYLTLSHRWGTAKFLRLEQLQLAKFEEGFNIVDLPRTFRDAVAVTKRLGCKYPWIDSLCIIQDSADDWSHEAGLMGEVYANSLCNIAATGSITSDDGCFMERNASEVSGLVVNPKWAGLSTTTFRIVDFGLWERLITSAPLNKRAWVVQERLLSPRVLHFGRTQLAWECRELDACETYSDGLPAAQENAQSTIKGLDPDIDGKKLQSMGGSKSSPNLHAYHLWNKIVTLYTAGDLTVASNKLVALSGLAKKMQIMLQDEYLAGLWKGTLASDLLWMVISGKQANGLPSIRPDQYRAPSWTWATLDGHIKPGRPNTDRILISIEEAGTDLLVRENPFGEVTSGWIRLRGALLQGKITLLNPSALRSDRLSVRFTDRKVTGDQWVFPDVHGEVSEQLVFFLFVCTTNHYDHTEVQGLALHCIDPAKGTHRRMGLFEGNYKKLDQDLPIRYSKLARKIVFSEDAELQTIILI